MIVKYSDTPKRDSYRVNMFVANLRRMLRTCTEHGIELTLAFLRGEDRFVLKLDDELESYFCDPRRNRVLDLTPIVNAYPLRDEHLSASGHRRLAEFLMQEMNLDGTLVATEPDP